MISFPSVLYPLRECPENPHHGIDTPVTFPCEPQTKKTICPILRPNRGDRTPEETPEIAATEIVIETATEIAAETETEPATARARKEVGRDNSRAAAGQVVDAPAASLGPFS